MHIIGPKVHIRLQGPVRNSHDAVVLVNVSELKPKCCTLMCHPSYVTYYKLI